MGHQHHDASDTRVVSRDVALHCDDELGRPMAFIATATYDPADPYAVGLTFHVPAGDIPWLMARSLLDAGLTAPAGEGDVVVWPALDEEGRDVVGMDFHTPEGRLLAQVRARELRDFLDRSYELVPAGAEDVDVDALIDSLLTA